MTRKLSFTSIFLIALTSLLLPLSSATTPVSDFDGTYSGKFTITATITVPSKPPQKISKTSTMPMELLVRNGVIVGWAQGSVLNKAGDASITVTIAPYGNITFTSHFVRNASTQLTSVTGTLSGSFPSIRTIISGKFSATGTEKFVFNARTLPDAKIGQKYPSGISFCTPAVQSGALCGLNKNSTNPSAGEPPYTFKLQNSGGFLPTGMTLNASTGTISGTPISGQKTGVRILVVCAYDATDRFTGVCRTVTLLLNP